MEAMKLEFKILKDLTNNYMNENKKNCVDKKNSEEIKYEENNFL